MGRIVVTEYLSLDGVFEAPSGAEPFERSGWIDGIPRGAEGDAFKLQETLAADAQLLGRRTYDAFAPVWPQFEGELADRFNAMPKHVVSSTPIDPTWHNTSVITGDLVGAVTGLRERYARDILVHGSGQLVQALIEHDLVDALHVLVYPVVVGAGRKLFGNTSGTKAFTLQETETFGDGVCVMRYARA